MSLEILQEQVEGVQVISPAGRLDTNTAKILDERLTPLTDIAGCRVVLDMSQVDYVSSFGLRVILIAAKKTSAQSGRLALCNLHKDVSNVFRISGFLKVLTVLDDRAGAVAAVSES